MRARAHVCVAVLLYLHRHISQGSETKGTSELSYRFPLMRHTWLQAYMQHKVFISSYTDIFSEREKIVTHIDMAIHIFYLY